MTEDLAYSVEGSKLPEEIHRGISIPNGKVVPVRDSSSRQNDLERESGRYPQDGAGLSSAPLGQSHLPIGWIYRKNPLSIPREPENTQQLQARHILSGYMSIV